ncbi:MAG: SIMPL domain-containing protein [Candidatus Shapirobacteria bacterium]
MKKIILIVLVVAGAIYFVPKMDWGKIRWIPAETVTVTGEAKSQQKNQIASFSAGIDAVNDSKENAVKEVNTKMESLIKAAKDFGVSEGDIKTQSLNYYQSEEVYYDNGIQKSRKGQWRVSNSVTITLREIDKSGALADMLASSGANNVYGPNFQFDDTSEFENSLFDLAIKNAKIKAETIAMASGRKLGKVISVNEGFGGGNIYPMMASKGAEGGGGAPIEVGTGTVSKSVTVVFELK